MTSRAIPRIFPCLLTAPPPTPRYTCRSFYFSVGWLWWINLIPLTSLQTLGDSNTYKSQGEKQNKGVSRHPIRLSFMSLSLPCRRFVALRGVFYSIVFIGIATWQSSFLSYTLLFTPHFLFRLRRDCHAKKRLAKTEWGAVNKRFKPFVLIL